MSAHVDVRGEPLSEPIYWTGEQWALTAYGVEARDGTYAIPYERVDEPDWLTHMRAKPWVNAQEFSHVMYLASARQFHQKHQETQKRKVLNEYLMIRLTPELRAELERLAGGKRKLSGYVRDVLQERVSAEAKWEQNIA